MTNAAKVQELCRQIRGIALNYPDGMQQIAATVHACTVPSVVVTSGYAHTQGPEPVETTVTSTWGSGDILARAGQYMADRPGVFITPHEAISAVWAEARRLMTDTPDEGPESQPNDPPPTRAEVPQAETPRRRGRPRKQG